MVETALRLVFFLVISFVIGGIIVWIKGIRDQKQRNVINEINFEGRKINLNSSTKPLDDLINDSNKSHGADDKALESDAGVKAKKE